MITQFMSPEQIHGQIVTDNDIAYNLVHGRMRKTLLRSKAKGEPFYHFRWRSYKTRQQYIVCVCHIGGTSALIRLVAEVQSDSGNTYYSTHTLMRLSHVDAYTAHYVSRFIERTGMQYDRDLAIATIVSGSPLRLQLYANEDTGELVYMCQHGIDLCIRNGRMVTHRTFVSSSMLLGTQLEAYNQLRNEYESATKEIKQTCVTGKQETMIVILDSRIVSRSQDIYSKYFINSKKAETNG